MRLFFFILLLVNVAVFAFFIYRDQGATNLRTQRAPLNAERIRVAVPTETPAPAPPAAAVATLTCLVWSGIKPEEIDQARQALDKLALGDKLTQAPVTEYWLYIPPLKNKTDAQKKLAELTALGIEDGQLIDAAGKWRWAISFAGHPSEDAAVVRLNQLKEKGVKSAKILKRDVPGNAFNIAQADEKMRAELNQIKSAFFGTELNNVDCKTP